MSCAIFLLFWCALALLSRWVPLASLADLCVGILKSDAWKPSTKASTSESCAPTVARKRILGRGRTLSVHIRGRRARRKLYRQARARTFEIRIAVEWPFSRKTWYVGRVSAFRDARQTAGAQRDDHLPWRMC